jgi:hypothetical protein
MEFIVQAFLDVWNFYSQIFESEVFRKSADFFWVSSYLWAPFILAIIFWNVWIRYIRAKFLSEQKWVMLELKLPPEVDKSPLAMELALVGLHQTGREGDWYAKYIKGKSRTFFSLEIASFEGNIHFYIRTEEAFKNIVEAQIYGQYPDVEIDEVPDYTEFMPYFDKERWKVFGLHYILTKSDSYPIRTYVDFKLDKDPKEEYKIDPLTTVLEFMSLLGKGEYMWLQLVIRSHKFKTTGKLFDNGTDWIKETKKLYKELHNEFSTVMDMEGKPILDQNGKPQRRFLTTVETEMLEAINRSTSKLGFDVGIRSVYFSPIDNNGKNNFVGTRISGLMGLLKPFNHGHMNGFKPDKATSFDFPWEDIGDLRLNHKKWIMVDAYRRRSFFHPPYKYKEFVLNQESLATIFHLPGTILQTPSVNRVQSRKATPPNNLPF